jgi:hypothetical protein
VLRLFTTIAATPMTKRETTTAPLRITTGRWSLARVSMPHITTGVSRMRASSSSNAP